MTEMTQMTRKVKNPNNFIHKGITASHKRRGSTPNEERMSFRRKLNPTLESIASINVSTT